MITAVVVPEAPSTTALDPALVQAVIDLGQLSLAFGRVPRRTYHEDGLRPESDTDHTVMLGLIACSLAPAMHADLDLGLVAQYALVHDVVEVYAGDTPTLRQPDAATRAAKADRERRAWQRIHNRYADVSPWLPDLIAEYEALSTPEARYVKAVDKVLPKITHLLNDLTSVAEQQMSVAELAESYRAQGIAMAAYAGDFPVLLALREVLVERMLQRAAAKAAETGETSDTRSRSR